MPRYICFALPRRRQSLDSIVIPPSDHFFRAMLLKALIHFISCNSLALGYLAAAVPHWQIPFVMPSLSPQPETHWFFFSLLQPYPIHSTLLDMKRFNFCSHIHPDSKRCFLFRTHFSNISNSSEVSKCHLFLFVSVDRLRVPLCALCDADKLIKIVFICTVRDFWHCMSSSPC